MAFGFFFVTVWGLGRSSGNGRKKGRLRGATLWKIGYLFGDHFRHLFCTFVFRGPPGHKKRGSGRAFETGPVFWSLLESARRASGGFPPRRQLNFHFCRRAQKGLQNGSQNGAFWAPESSLYSLWSTMGDKLVPQKWHCKKRQQKREFYAPMWAARRNVRGQWG